MGYRRIKEADMDNSAEYKIDANFRWFRIAAKANDELYLVQCGIEQCKPDKYYGPAIRTEYHVHFILDGKGVFEVNNVSYRLGRGQIFVVTPGEEHYYYADSQEPWRYTWISFGGTRAGYFLEKAGLTKAQPVREAYVEPQQFLSVIEKILNNHQLTIVNELKRTSLLYEVMALLVDSGNKVSVSEKHDYSPDVYVNSAAEYIKGHYAHIRVSDIASYLGISRYYLSHIFKEKFHISPQEYLVKYRLEKGEELLRTTNLSIQEVSDKTGYENPLTFSKIFKKVYGLSPKNYRLKKNRGP